MTEPTIVGASEPLAAATILERRRLSRWKVERFLRLHRERGA